MELVPSNRSSGNTKEDLNTTSIDALSFTIFPKTYCSEANLDSYLERVCLELFNVSFSEAFYETSNKEIAAKRHYRRAYSYGNMIFIMYDAYGGNSTGTVHINIKGKACNTLDLDFIRIRNFIYDNGCNVTELHLANDDRHEVLSFDRIKRAFEYETYTSPLKWSDYQKSRGGKAKSRSLIFGRKPVRIVFYEKGDYEGVTFPWLRVELQLRDEKAHSALRYWHEGQDLGEVSKGLLKSMLDLKNEREKDTNMSRRSTAFYWSRFLGDVGKRTWHKKVKSDGPPDCQKQLKRFTSMCENRIKEHGIETIDEIWQALREKYAVVGF